MRARESEQELTSSSPVARGKENNLNKNNQVDDSQWLGGGARDLVKANRKDKRGEYLPGAPLSLVEKHSRTTNNLSAEVSRRSALI